MVNLQLQLLKVAFHEGRQYPKNDGFWASWERLINKSTYMEITYSDPSRGRITLSTVNIIVIFSIFL
jgi:hypothetical protein